MRRHSPDKPKVSRAIFRWFAFYTRWYLRRHFHSVRILRGSAPKDVAGPAIVCLNHPSWWDPLLAITLATTTFPGRTHYAPIDSAALKRYQIFERLGFFGIESGSLKGTARFLQMAHAILRDSQNVLWITPEGRFTDTRTRPVHLRGGTGHLVHSLSNVTIVPLALEYTFWEERCPEALACWGEPISVSKGHDQTPEAWTQVLAEGMQAASDRLALASLRRDKDAFQVLLSGSVGIGGVYDRWRAFKAKLHGERFVPQHGAEEL